MMLKSKSIALPKPKVGGMSAEEAIRRRRSVREYLRTPITLDQLSQILWAAQGITDAQNGHRAAPSPGAKYTLELYVFTRERGVTGLPAGLYHYEPDAHSITRVKTGDHTPALQSAAGDQEQVGTAAVIIAITGIFEKAMAKYGERGIQYSLQESGSAGENIYIESTAIGLGTVMMGSFDDDQVSQLIGTRKGETPILLMPIGALA
ncbi:MAG TPA: SagB/ThcOx family dehydrogenase [Nitrososphaerales archaeon]|nr:SagB/ThcOx family dehydrogenase [Nitrososphaerales archaeon]